MLSDPEPNEQVGVRKTRGTKALLPGALSAGFAPAFVTGLMSAA
jgi:hypothetical protein